MAARLFAGFPAAALSAWSFGTSNDFQARRHWLLRAATGLNFCR